MSAAVDLAESALTVDAIFREHAPYVWRALRRLGVHEADVEDVCQEVFVVVHRRLGSFDGACAVRTWLYGICIRTASDYRRRPHRRRESPAGDDLPDIGSPPAQEDELEQRRALDRLDAALGELDDAKRAVFVLYEIEGLQMPEVAQAIGCPLQTAYSRLHAARRIMTRLLAAEAEAEPSGGGAPEPARMHETTFDRESPRAREAMGRCAPPGQRRSAG